MKAQSKKEVADLRHAGEMVKEALEVGGITQVELAERVGKDQTLISRFLSGQIGISEAVLRSIARALGIDFEKLRHQMRRDNLYRKLERLRAEFRDVIGEGERIEIFSGQAVVGAAILSDITTVPMLDSVPVSAHDLSGEESVRCPLPPGVEVDAENSFAVRITGEDMADDKVDEGDIVVVDFKAKARDGDVVLAMVSGQPMLRKIYRRGKTIVLQASTEREESVIFLSKSDEFEILGRMVLCIKLFTS